MPLSKDPYDRRIEPAPTAEAAGYLMEMLTSLSHFAHISGLQNSAAMLAAASQVVAQERRLLAQDPPRSRQRDNRDWPHAAGPYESDGRAG